MIRRMRRLYILGSLLALLVLAVLPIQAVDSHVPEQTLGPVAQPVSCPGALPTRLRNGYPGAAINPNGSNMRAQPTVLSELVGLIPQNAVFDVLDGPRCADGYAWWEVRYNSITGWVAEGTDTDYWLESRAPVYLTIDAGDVRLLLNTFIAPTATGRVAPPTDLGARVLPEHIRFILDGYPNRTDPDLRGDTAHITVFPVMAFNRLYDDRLVRLQSLIADQGLDPLPPDNLPVTSEGIRRAVTARPAYLDFASGTGIRFLAYYNRFEDTINREQIYYVYLGLSDDGMRFVQVFMPVVANALPPQDSAFIQGTYNDYLTETQRLLESAPATTFSPSLNDLDQMIELLSVRLGETNETVTLRGQGLRMVVERGIATGASIESVPAVEPGPGVAFWQEVPAHIRVMLDGQPPLDAGLPHVAVYPTDEYNFQFVGTIDTLSRLLASDNPVPEAPLGLPVIGLTREAVFQPQLVEFQGGRGVRFLAYFSNATRYVTEDDLAYVFLGLTSDGDWLVQVILPVVAEVLPPTPPADFDYDAFVENYDAYLEDLRRTVNNAPTRSFAPRLDLLDAMVESIRVE